MQQKSIHNGKTRDKKRRMRAFMWEYKATHPCVRCGESHPATLDFHHVEAKRKDVGGMKLNPSWNTLFAEMAKCILICANCHRKEHYDNDEHFENARKIVADIRSGGSPVGVKKVRGRGKKTLAKESQV